eukprot:gb/GECH01005780.1/.p1 GENE.gb/GECH01005780.1/~~gb/GECH01005780.1/.p1  ORF type:complete len:354 (+),score=107.90 gb/GECH01005780.1/:1-1062(+)
MAKVGEEDPRWIVEEREDGTNVGNWHWSERNAMGWCKEEIRQQLVGLEFSLGDGCTARINKLASVSGEAYWNNRKGKVFAIYELDIKLDWEGNMQIGDEEVSANGQVHMPYISVENDYDDFEMKITLSGSETQNNRKIKDKMHKNARPEIRKRMVSFLENLNNCSVWKLPKHETKKKEDSAIKQAAEEAKKEVVKDSKIEEKSSEPSSVETETIQLKEKFKARPGDIFECMLDEKRVSGFTSSKCTVDPQVGGEYTLFDGMISGKYTKIESPKKMKMTFRAKDWPQNHVSDVDITLVEDEPGDTTLHLTQKNVPVNDAQGASGVISRTEQGWRENYFMRMKVVFGFGGTPGLL